MRIVVAPQEYKGSLTAAEAAQAIADGVRDALPDAETVLAPMSDGGAGLVDALLAAHGGERRTARVHDPLMRPMDATWALLRGGVAAIEMAAASGLVLLRPEERDPMRASTYGTGDLILDALDAGCREVIVGVGGSATVDAGAGAATAFGARLLDAFGDDLPSGGGELRHLDRIDLTGLDARIAITRVRVAADVTNMLCGPQGAAAVYGPQKGASPEAVAALDAGLARFAEVARRDCAIDVGALAGGGAAGGLAAGLAAFAGASIERGFQLVAEAAGLAGVMAGADIVITGEGELDTQTGYGKTVAGVAALARSAGARVVVIAGSVEAAAHSRMSFDAVISLSERAGSAEIAMRDAAALLRAAAADAVRSG